MFRCMISLDDERQLQRALTSADSGGEANAHLDYDDVHRNINEAAHWQLFSHSDDSDWPTLVQYGKSSCLAIALCRTPHSPP